MEVLGGSLLKVDEVSFVLTSYSFCVVIAARC